ncbi:hypothetical protein [Tenacibaculum xiamenense]|uniref:hypothetical protein n=1 Tax=Tenacibaculum xiamenense TaxID=1261553 RepID=UPI00389450E6
MLKRFGILSEKRKVSAKSLPYVIITLLLVGIVLSSIVLMVSYFYKITNELESQDSLIDNAKSIRNFCSSNFGNENIFQSTFGELDGMKNVVVRKSKWGLIDKVHFKTWVKNDTLKETLFLGERRSKNISLYIPNNSKQLKLGGKTIIEGDAYFPMSTFGELYIPQKINDITIKGEINKSSDHLPKVEDFFIEKNVEPIDLFDFNMEYSNSFFSPTKKISIEKGVLENIKINGNVIIESQQKLIIKRSAKLRDVIIIAPEVLIEGGFTGNIQLLATKSIKLEENVMLEFPSVLYLKGKKEGEILIEDKSLVLGAVVAVSDQNKVEVTINKNTKIMGDIFCMGNLMVHGQMYGEVMANDLCFRTNESEYENAALDLQIFNLPSFACHLNLFEKKKSTYKVIKCIK